MKNRKKLVDILMEIGAVRSQVAVALKELERISDDLRIVLVENPGEAKEEEPSPCAICSGILDWRTPSTPKVSPCDSVVQYVYCPNCQSRGPLSGTKADAVRRWNLIQERLGA